MGETVSQWILSLPVGGVIAWLVGMGILYSIGINLSRRGSRWWLVVSFISVLMSYAYMDAYILGAELEADPVVGILEALIAATLIIVMVRWGRPQKAKSNQ